MSRKGPGKGIARVTTIAFYPHQYEHLLRQRIEQGKGSMADVIRTLVEQDILAKKSGQVKPAAEEK